MNSLNSVEVFFGKKIQKVRPTRAFLARSCGRLHPLSTGGGRPAAWSDPSPGRPTKNNREWTNQEPPSPAMTIFGHETESLRFVRPH